MSAIHVDFLNCNESFLGTRTIYREIKEGKLVHMRLRRADHESGYVEKGPDLARLAAGFHLEIDPGIHRDRVLSWFSLSDYRYRVRIEGLLRLAKENERNLIVGIFGVAQKTDRKGNELTPWKEVELEYMPHYKHLNVWFMETTSDPLPCEMLTWNESFALLYGRLGKRMKVRLKEEIREFLIAEAGSPLMDGLKTPVEQWGGTIAVGVSFERQPASTWIPSRSWVPIDVPSHAERCMNPPYLLANGELHMRTPQGRQIISYPEA